MASRASNNNQENEEEKAFNVYEFLNDDASLYETPPPTPSSGSRLIESYHIPTQEEVFSGTSERVPQLSDSGEGTSVAFDHLNDASISRNPDSESRYEEAALRTVAYDYMFKKQLTPTDVSGRFHVPKAEVERHLLSLQNTGQAITVELRVYDLNKKQTMTWSLLCNQSGCFIIRSGWGNYIDGNNLQDKDSVLFYTRKNNQKINNDTIPPYAVQIERSGETVETGMLYIPLTDLENATPPATPASGSRPIREVSSQISDSRVKPSVGFNHSSGASISEHPESVLRQNRHEEAALGTVIYDFVFKKQLTPTDVSEGLHVPKAEVEKHLPYLQNSCQPITDELQVYDINRKQTMTWSLLCNMPRCFIRRRESSKYVDGNNLQDRDSVLFYKRNMDQIIDNDALPPYAVQIQRSGETVETGMLYIPYNDLENTTAPPTIASGSHPIREVSSQISDSGVRTSVAFNHSGGASISEHPESEPRQIRYEEAATVTYFFIFKKQLDPTDMSSTFHIPKEEAKRHFNFVRGSLQPVYVQIYDCNRKQTLKWRLLFNRLEYFITTESNYVSGNNLQPGDSVLFYRTTNDQMNNDTPLPPFAVQFEKSGETVEMGMLHIQLNDLENSGKSEDS